MRRSRGAEVMEKQDDQVIRQKVDKGKSGQVEGKEGDVHTGGPVPTLSTVTKTDSFIPLSLFSLFPYSLIPLPLS